MKWIISIFLVLASVTSNAMTFNFQNPFSSSLVAKNPQASDQLAQFDLDEEKQKQRNFLLRTATLSVISLAATNAIFLPYFRALYQFDLSSFVQLESVLGLTAVAVSGAVVGVVWNEKTNPRQQVQPD